MNVACECVAPENRFGCLGHEGRKLLDGHLTRILDEGHQPPRAGSRRGRLGLPPDGRWHEALPRRILHTGEQELETHAYMGTVPGPFIDSTSATHFLELPRALFETRTFSLHHQVEVDINGRHAVRHIRFEQP